MTMTMMMEKKASLNKAYGLYIRDRILFIWDLWWHFIDSLFYGLVFFVSLFFRMLFPKKKTRQFLFHDGLAVNAFAFCLNVNVMTVDLLFYRLSLFYMNNENQIRKQLFG